MDSMDTIKYVTDLTFFLLMCEHKAERRLKEWYFSSAILHNSSKSSD